MRTTPTPIIVNAQGDDMINDILTEAEQNAEAGLESYDEVQQAPKQPLRSGIKGVAARQPAAPARPAPQQKPAAKAPVKAAEPEVDEEEDDGPSDPLDLIPLQFPALSRHQLETWKAQHGRIHAFIPDEDTIVIFKRLRRLEHTMIQNDLRLLASTDKAKIDPTLVDTQYQERVLRASVLFPSVDQAFLTMSDAGLIPALFGVIMDHSKFMSGEQAFASCIKL